jgi:Flp pilus assembly protein TadG
MRRLRRDDAGVTTLEFAMIAPVLFIMLFGLLAVAYRAWALSEAQHGARVAARTMSIKSLSGTYGSTADAAAAAQGVVYGGLSNAKVTATSLCTAQGSDPVTAKVTYDSGFLSSLLTLVPVPDLGWGTVSATASAPCE